MALAKFKHSANVASPTDPILRNLVAIVSLALERFAFRRQGKRVNPSELIESAPRRIGSDRRMRMDPFVKGDLARRKKKRAALETWNEDTGSSLLGGKVDKVVEETALRYAAKMQRTFQGVKWLEARDSNTTGSDIDRDVGVVRREVVSSRGESPSAKESPRRLERFAGPTFPG